MDAMFQPWDISFSLFKPKRPLREEATKEEIVGGAWILDEETLTKRLETAAAVMINFEAVMIVMNLRTLLQTKATLDAKWN